MASGYGKKTFGQKVKSFFKKALGITLIGGAAATPLYYQYGTQENKEVKVTSVDTKWGNYNAEKGGYDKTYSITTSAGLINNENSFWHFKNNAEDIQRSLVEGKTYHVETYGVNFSSPIGNWTLRPNILKATPVTEEELKAREALKSKQQQEQKAQSAVTSPTVPPAGATTPAQVPQNVTYSIQFQGYEVNVTTPMEAFNKVTINTVKPVAQPAPVTPAPQPPAP